MIERGWELLWRACRRSRSSLLDLCPPISLFIQPSRCSTSLAASQQRAIKSHPSSTSHCSLSTLTVYLINDHNTHTLSVQSRLIVRCLLVLLLQMWPPGRGSLLRAKCKRIHECQKKKSCYGEYPPPSQCTLYAYMCMCLVCVHTSSNSI